MRPPYFLQMVTHSVSVSLHPMQELSMDPGTSSGVALMQTQRLVAVRLPSIWIPCHQSAVSANHLYTPSPVHACFAWLVRQWFITSLLTHFASLQLVSLISTHCMLRQSRIHQNIANSKRITAYLFFN